MTDKSKKIWKGVGITALILAVVWAFISLLTGKWNPRRWFHASTPEGDISGTNNTTSGIGRQYHQCPAGQHYENGQCIPNTVSSTGTLSNNASIAETERLIRIINTNNNLTERQNACSTLENWCATEYAHSGSTNGFYCTAYYKACGNSIQKNIVSPNTIISPNPTGGRPNSGGTGVGTGTIGGINPHG